MANTNADVLRPEATEANIPTTIREKQLGFATDTHAICFKATGGTTYYLDARGEDHYIGEYLYHSGDTDTYLRFNTNIVQLFAGGNSIIENDGTSIIINNNGADLDTIIEGDTDTNLIHVDAGNDRVGISTSTPQYTLDVSGDMSITEFIYHSGDANTYVRLEDDEISLYAGAKLLFDGDSIALQLATDVGIGDASTKTSSVDNLQIDDYGYYAMATLNQSEIGNNFYYNSGNYKFANNSRAHKISFLSSGIGLYVSDRTGTEDDNIAWVEGMRIDHTTGKMSAKRDFQVDGNMYFGTSGGMTFGHCYGNEIAWSQASAVQNTWYDISDSDMADGELNNVTHDGSGQLTVSATGAYLIIYSGSFEADATGVHVQVTVSINGTESVTAINHLETTATSKQYPVGGQTILDLSANDTVNVSIRTTDAGTPTLSADHIMLSVLNIGGASGASSSVSPSSSSSASVSPSASISPSSSPSPSA